MVRQSVIDYSLLLVASNLSATARDDESYLTTILIDSQKYYPHCLLLC